MLETSSRNGLLSCLPLRWDYPELLHETHDIPLLPVFDDLASRKPRDGNACHKSMDGEPATFCIELFGASVGLEFLLAECHIATSDWVEARLA